MPQSLISFLGRGRDNRTTGYRSARYHFPDGMERETPFFGLALADHLQPDELILLGTAGSQWGVLLGSLATESEVNEALLELMDAEAEQRVTQSQLDALTPLISRAVGYPVQLLLIPFGRDDSEQLAILSTLAERQLTGTVHFDLTHGFRHLGMVGFLSAFMLEQMVQLKVAGLWYGALEMTQNGTTPVLRLDGLNAVQHWIDALGRFDQSGDYGLFAPLLERDGMAADKVRALEEAAFYERNFNLKDAAHRIRLFLPQLDQPLSGTSALFQAILRQRLLWVKGASLAHHQRRLARQYFERRDYVRALVLAWESIISRECEQHGLNPDDYAQEGGRKQAAQKLKERLKEEGQPWHRSPERRIELLRNTLAHTSPPPAKATELKKALASEEALRATLEEAFKALEI